MTSQGVRAVVSGDRSGVFSEKVSQLVAKIRGLGDKKNLADVADIFG